jgi:hypothetical protein
LARTRRCAKIHSAAKDQTKEQQLGDAILNAVNYRDVELQLVQNVPHTLGFASASLFREQDAVFRRTAADQAWDETTAECLDVTDPMLDPVSDRRPYDLNPKVLAHHHLPKGLMQPIVAVPVGDQLRYVAVALYGPHATGNDLSHDERTMLAELADKAASVLR